MRNKLALVAVVAGLMAMGAAAYGAALNSSACVQEVRAALGQNPEAVNSHASGIVLDDKGKPVAGATVTVAPFGRDPVQTDADGKFKVQWQTWQNQNGPTGSLLVREPKAQLATLFPLEDMDKLDDLKITLAPAIAITGTVVDPDNRPVPGADVRVILQMDRYNSWIRDANPTQTEQDGKYAARALPADQNYMVIVQASGFGRKQIEVEGAKAGKERQITLDALVLKRGTLTVTGVVVDEDGKPVSGAGVNALGGEQNVQVVETDKEGKFTLKGLCDGEAMIRAWKDVDGARQFGSINYSADMKEVRVVLGENAQQGGPGAGNMRASGVVLDGQGKPVAGATVTVVPFGQNNSVRTDTDGKFKVRWQTWGNQNGVTGSLLVREPNAQLAALFPIEDVDKMADLKITLAPGTAITGTVVDPDNRPIPKADIGVMLRVGRYSSWIGGYNSIKTDQDGKYAVRALPADENYQIMASADHFGRKNESVDMTAAKDRTVEVEPIVLKPANLTITGTVVDSDDKPVSGAQIQGWGNDQNVQPSMSGKAGKFTLKNVCEGQLMIRAQKQAGNRWQMGTVNYTPDMQEVRIVLGENAQGMRAQMPKPKSLVGKPLPDVKTFGLDAPKDGKPVLVCFWSQDERPSRQCMNELIALSQSPEGKELAILTVQAEPVEREALGKWTEKLPVGMIQKDTEKVRAAWGVQNLPWLILAAPDGAVLAEGFQLAEWSAIWKAKGGK